MINLTSYIYVMVVGYYLSKNIGFRQLIWYLSMVINVINWAVWIKQSREPTSGFDLQEGDHTINLSTRIRTGSP